MHPTTFVLGAAAFAGFSAAQSSTQFNYPYSIDPDSVPQSERGMLTACDSNFFNG